jgi:hypothetical protein
MKNSILFTPIGLVILLVGCARAPLPSPILTGPTVSYEVILDFPDVKPGDPGVLVIDDMEDWAQVNSDQYRIFLVTPGDWRQAGTIELTSSGTEEAPRWLIYYDPENPKDQTHPWHMPADKRAFVDRIYMNGACWWVIDRLRLNKSNPVRQGSCHNVLNRLMIYEMDRANSRSSIHIGNQRDPEDKSNYNTVQNCVIGRTPPTPRKDGAGVYITNADHNRIVKNEIFDIPGDSVQTGQSGEHARGTIIQDNDFYLTTALYSDGSGNLTPDGPYAGAENAVDIKAHWQPRDELPPPEDEYMIIENNRMWGFRYTDRNVAATGSGGATVVIHYRTSSGVRVRNNLVFDGVTGYHCSYKAQRGPNQPRFHDVHDNLFWNIRQIEGARGTGQAISITEAWDSEYRNNIVVDCEFYLDMNTVGGNQRNRPYARRNVIDRNVFIASGRPERPDYHESVEFGPNAYYGSPPLPQNQDGDSIVRDDARAARHKPLRVTIKRITDPTVIEIPCGQITRNSPHAEWFKSFRK